jgi:dynein heavy chain
VKPLVTWLSDLRNRVEHLNDWGLKGQPIIFWLGGLTYPTSLLTALLQTSARKNGVSVDTLSFEFLPQTFDDAQITALPKEGSYIKWMTLENARWNVEQGALAEPEPMQLHNPMPTTLFKPIAKKKGKVDHSMYACPLYLYPVRTGSRERPSFMIWVDVKAGCLDSNGWIKRGAALLLGTKF